MTALPAARRGWEHDAACRDSKVFRTPMRESEDARIERETRAKQVCTDCPVRAECLEYALRVREPYGIWGGLNQAERFEMQAAVRAG
jgi:WhiB family transcriptional regulator, redox-sensing transcriptional regulator